MIAFFLNFGASLLHLINQSITDLTKRKHKHRPCFALIVRGCLFVVRYSNNNSRYKVFLFQVVYDYDYDYDYDYGYDYDYDNALQFIRRIKK